MSETDQVFALLVEANPVPNPAALPERIADVEPGLHVVDPGRTTMQTQPTTEHTTPEPPKRRTGWIAVAIAAVVVLVLGAAALLVLANDDTQPAVDEPPATTTPSATTVPPEPEAAPVDQARIDTATAKVEDFYAAINAGDADAALSLAYADGSFADDPSGEANRHVWEANAVFGTAYPFEIQNCESAGTLDDRVVVECTMVNPDPVWVALGVSEGLVAPWHVFDDGHMEWRAFRGDPFSLPNQAYVDYLELNHLDAYDEVCNPDAYPLGTVNSPQGYSLTKACAELATPLAEDVAAWIEAGRPDGAADADQARIDAAIVKTENWFTSINAGDADGALALVSPNEALPEAELRKLHFDAAFAAGYPWQLKGCEATSTLEGAVFVECAVVNTDPVWVAAGVGEVIFPWIIFDEGTMQRQHIVAPVDQTAKVYADYLRINHPDDYADVCDPQAHPAGTVLFEWGFAFTGECAALALPLAEDVAAWIEAGRPE